MKGDVVSRRPNSIFAIWMMVDLFFMSIVPSDDREGVESIAVYKVVTSRLGA
jgi:hypothetical protein